VPKQIRQSDRPAQRRPRRAVGQRVWGRFRPLVLLLGAATLLACARPEQPFVGELAFIEGDDILIIEARDGTVSAWDRETSTKRWSLRPVTDAAPGFVTVPTRHLVCPIERTLAGTLLLRYHTALVAVDGRTGKLLWQRKLVGWAKDEQRCPRAAADSGVLLLRSHGLFIQKLDREGKDEWVFAMERLGAALAPVHVVMPSGDALVRTRDYVVSISPDGRLGWAQPR